MIYYSRCNFSALHGGTIHCFDLVYPQSEKRAWDAIVTRITAAFARLTRPSPRPIPENGAGRCGIARVCALSIFKAIAVTRGLSHRLRVLLLYPAR
jgi:hypothetical protein